MATPPSSGCTGKVFTPSRWRYARHARGAGPLTAGVRHFPELSCPLCYTDAEPELLVEKAVLGSNLVPATAFAALAKL